MLAFLAEEEISIDYFTLCEELRRRDKEELAGGTAYIASLTDGLLSLPKLHLTAFHCV